MQFRKGREPAALRRWRSANPTETDWTALGTEQKEATRKALARDQHGTCCYCHGPAEPGSRIEHIVARDGMNTFAWDNLALACNGAEGLDPADYHCDKRKANRRLHVVHPYASPVVNLVRVAMGGHLKVRGENETLRVDIEETLNLNGRRPVGARRQAIEAALAELPKGRQWSARRVAGLLVRLREGGALIPYQAWVEQWLEVKLASR
jgi:uncharacterized protein (TIGR02646 family)